MLKVINLITDFCKANSDVCELVLNYTGKCALDKECVGILVKKGYSYMETIAKLTKFFDDNNYIDSDLLLEGMAIDDSNDDVVVCFPKIICEK